MANKQVDFDKLKVDLFATLEGVKPSPATSVKESVSEDFSSGSVSQINTIIPMKQKKLTNSLESEVTNNLDLSEDLSIQEFINNSIETCNSILAGLNTRREFITNEIDELRNNDDFDKAKNIKYAYKASMYAIDDLQDALEILQKILK